MLKNKRAVWAIGRKVCMINQIKLPFEETVYISETYIDTCIAIETMIVRGAGSIGAAAGFAMMQAASEAPKETYKNFLLKAKNKIETTRPTARDLFAAVDRVYKKALISVKEAVSEAQAIADETSDAGRKIGEYGNELIKDGFGILTHCNAGSLALVEYGSALAPIIKAHQSGKKITVYADETRPRNQGAKLTAWELQKAGIPHFIIADNAAGLLMMQGKIDIVITGADRIAANGDTANKIGTFEKAVLAKEFNIPFYIAAPDSTFDKDCLSGEDIPIEERSQEEVLFVNGIDVEGKEQKIQIANPDSKAYNPAFDITPINYISGFITSKGIKKELP